MHKLVSRKWKEFENIPFPSEIAGNEINDICVVSIDSSAAGIISSFDGTLSKDREKILVSCLKELNQILPELNGNAEIYFQKLKEICIDVLKINEYTNSN